MPLFKGLSEVVAGVLPPKAWAVRKHEKTYVKDDKSDPDMPCMDVNGNLTDDPTKCVEQDEPAPAAGGDVGGAKSWDMSWVKNSFNK